MLELPTTIDAVELAKSFYLHDLLTNLEKMKQIEDYSPLEISLLEEIIEEILSSTTPLEE
jgi:hypothetical protein